MNRCPWLSPVPWEPRDQRVDPQRIHKSQHTDNATVDALSVQHKESAPRMDNEEFRMVVHKAQGFPSYTIPKAAPEDGSRSPPSTIFASVTRAIMLCALTETELAPAP